MDDITHIEDVIEENAKLRELLQDVLDSTVDASAYPDGPNLCYHIRKEIKEALPKPPQ